MWILDSGRVLCLGIFSVDWVPSSLVRSDDFAVMCLPFRFTGSEGLD